jgi:hypothetical protein
MVLSAGCLVNTICVIGSPALKAQGSSQAFTVLVFLVRACSVISIPCGLDEIEKNYEMF